MPTVKHRVEYALLRVVTFLVRLMPLPLARRVGEGAGRLGYALGIRRHVAERQVAAVFPGLGAREVARIARQSYANLGRIAIELTLLPYLGDRALAALFEDEGDLRVITDLRDQYGSVVACTGHVGNWELSGAYVALRGVPIDGVARHLANPLVDGYVMRTRSRTGMRIIFDSDAVRKLPRGIKQGRVCGLIADQGVLGLASTYVPFFGRPAKTPRGPAVFALRFKLPVVFAAAVLQPSGKYRFVAERIEVQETGNREADVDAIITSFTHALERLVRRYPDQYFWQHRRWKRQPPDTPPELRDPVSS